MVDSLWREANTRRPTLPPSALTFDVKTAAAKNKFNSKQDIQNFEILPLATSGMPRWPGRVPMTETIHTLQKKTNKLT
jgi:hypothetical protein